jgi:hypothetical protein
MTQSKEYQESDKFKRLLLRQIKSGNSLLKRGFRNTDLPADVHTLESVVVWYDKFRQAGDRE